MHVLHVVGARPNFMKLAPVYQALLSRHSCRQSVIHTGQHYDPLMSQVFFDQLGLREPDENLAVGSGSHACQTAEVMKRFEPILHKYGPDIVLVYGDVNSTLSAALVCSKTNVKVGHVEAGLRSFDRTMPEEINRVLTDQLADIHFTPSQDADENLLKEGIAANKIRLVGNVMIDTLVRLLPLATCSLPTGCPERYGLVTLHRPSNVDERTSLREIFVTLSEISRDIDLIFPVHPRTQQQFRAYGLSSVGSRLHLVEPMPYLTFLGLQQNAAFVITDSGGIQEETTYLGVPCFTVRSNTERPITVTHGTNILVGEDMGQLRAEVQSVLHEKKKERIALPPLWDGHAGERIATELDEFVTLPVGQASIAVTSTANTPI